DPNAAGGGRRRARRMGDPSAHGAAGVGLAGTGVPRSRANLSRGRRDRRSMVPHDELATRAQSGSEGRDEQLSRVAGAAHGVAGGGDVGRRDVSVRLHVTRNRVAALLATLVWVWPVAASALAPEG